MIKPIKQIEPAAIGIEVAVETVAVGESTAIGVAVAAKVDC